MRMFHSMIVDSTISTTVTPSEVSYVLSVRVVVSSETL